MTTRTNSQFLTVAALLLALPFLGACKGKAAAAATAESGGTANVPQAEGTLPNIHLTSPMPGAEWHIPSGDYSGTRFSSLGQINTDNVKNLRVISTMSTGIPHGHEGQPLVANNTMYVVTPYPNNLIALDLTKPGFPKKWIYEPHPSTQAVGIACCDIVNRGASFADGKIVYATLDANVVAVDAITGKEAWKTKVGDINIGETITGAVLIVGNLALIGNSGGELGVRGKVVALDVSTGKEIWRAYSTGPDNDVLIGPEFKAFYPKDQGKDLGTTSWVSDQWKVGGGTIWGWITYDPELDLIFYGTGNPGVWNQELRPGANKWSCTIWARDPKTGKAKWSYQITAHDEWDYDEIMENIAVDMDWNGSPRKLLLHPGRSGFMYVLDRQTGELLSAEPFQPVNWASGYDLKTGEPHEDPAKQIHTGAFTRDICPSSTGGKEFVPSAFSPRTGLLYIPAHNTCMDYSGVEANYIAGTPYLGADVRMFPGPGNYQGELVAWDVAHSKKVWGIKEAALPVYSGVLATGGDVVFYGSMDGWFRAVDARNGTVLWQFKTASGIVGNPMTFTGPDGKQYVAIYSGIGGWMGAVDFPSLSTDDDYAALGVVGAMKGIKRYTEPGDVVYIFGL